MIYIYNGPGTSRDSIRHTIHSFEKIALEPIQSIDYQKLMDAEWVKHAKLLIVPGGADVPYVKKLNGKGNQIIQKFVEEGGSYLGICAGGYYGTAFVEFDKGGPSEVLGARELAFFPGKTIGPILAAYDYNSNKGVRAALIEFNGKKTYVYFSGGPYFEKASQIPMVEVLSTYQDQINLNQAAIVKMNVKKGTVVLSGVHFEYAPELLDENDTYLKDVIPTLLTTNESRLMLTCSIAQTLNLQLR